MSDDNLQDLKQFITTTVSQQLTFHSSELKNSIEKLDKKLSKKIDDLSASVSDALDNFDQTTNDQFKNHEKRIIKLEQKLA